MSKPTYFVREEYAPTDKRPVIVALDAAYIPIAIAAIEGRKPRSFWASDEDYTRGSDALSAFQEGLMSDITPSLIGAIDRVYMAVRQLSAGQEFGVDIYGQPEPLPAVPPHLPSSVSPGMLASIENLRGLLPSGWPFGIGDEPASLADIVTALKSASPEQKTQVQDTFDALAAASEEATIVNTVRGFWQTAQDGTLEGGQLLMSGIGIVGVMSALSLMGAKQRELGDKLDRVIAALDGGGSSAPTDNIVAELASIRTQVGG
jgi:hypothetical protein